jgi:hypothetical protein
MIDLAELEQELRRMEPGSKLYELVKLEIQARGRWKAKPRGKVFKRGEDPRRKVDF